MAEAVNEPSLRHDLHPCADAGGTRPNPHQAKVAILKGFEDSAQRRSVHVCGSRCWRQLSIFARGPLRASKPQLQGRVPPPKAATPVDSKNLLRLDSLPGHKDSLPVLDEPFRNGKADTLQMTVRRAMPQ